jgi:hypothetical protein
MRASDEKKRKADARKQTQLLRWVAVEVCRALFRSVNGRELSRQRREKLKSEQNRVKKELSNEGNANVSPVKEELTGDSKSLTYGEVVPETFLQLLQLCRAAKPAGKERKHKLSKKVRNGANLLSTEAIATEEGNENSIAQEPFVFYDLGCGTGKSIIAAALRSGQHLHSSLLPSPFTLDLLCTHLPTYPRILLPTSIALRPAADEPCLLPPPNSARTLQWDGLHRRHWYRDRP